MFHTTDIHCHILPGVDDGAKDPGQTLKMLELAYKDGVRRIIATPHVHPKRGNHPELWGQAFRETVKLAAEKFPEMEIYTGCEILYTSDILTKLEEGDAITMAEGPYVLIEFEPDAEFAYILRGLQKVRMGGYLPVLAHVERQASIKSLEQAEELIGQGVYLQMNAGTVLQSKKLLKGKFVRELLKNEMIHLIGTDAHEDAIRTPEMRQAYEVLKTLTDTGCARRLCGENAGCIIRGEFIDG